MYSSFCIKFHLLSLGEKLFATCLDRSAASDEPQVLSRSVATGIEDEELELVLKTSFTLDSCGHCSDSNFSASFLFEVLSSVTDRVSEKAVGVDGICSHGLPSVGRSG